MILSVTIHQFEKYNLFNSILLRGSSDSSSYLIMSSTSMSIIKKMADDITETVSTVPKMPEIPPRKSDRYAKSGEEMMDILVEDIMRYEELSELPLNRQFPTYFVTLINNFLLRPF
jgi:hypothetical protein